MVYFFYHEESLLPSFINYITYVCILIYRFKYVYILILTYSIFFQKCPLLKFYYNITITVYKISILYGLCILAYLTYILLETI
jgi:high-affinity nickel permease